MATLPTIDLEAQAELADNAVSELCGPELMSKAQAVEFLELVVERCRSSIEALNEEMENAEEDDT